MAVPKKRTSKRRRDMRRSHHALKNNAAIMICPSCGAPKLMHHVCAACGTYRGTQVVAPVEDA